MDAQGILEDSRKELLKQVEAQTSQGVERLRWLTARDIAVCSLCTERDGKQYTIDEIRDVLGGEFCQPDDAHGRCRCTLMPAAKLETAGGEVRAAGATQTVNSVAEPSGTVRQVLVVAAVIVLLALLWLAIR